ncbi:MAG TPA: thiamine pyrophosphate-binding protein, partial [Minicystis sp.]|nr:thiamine pyrophosphate-binding protein [Minicystis sp.]
MSHGSAGPSKAPEFVAALKANGFDFFAGVPCSLLKGLVSLLDGDASVHYVSATREDSALGMAAGAYLGGKTPMVLMQNSGLGVSVNALASLSTMYELPALLVISWRGEPSLNDAPEHIMMGEIMQPVLELMKIPHKVLSADAPMQAQVAWAKERMAATKKPVALIAPAGVLE